MSAPMQLYRKANTIVHRLHPVTKMILLLLSFAVSLAFTHPVHLGVLVLLALTVTAASRAIASLERAWKPMSVLFLVTVLLWSLLRRGQTPLLQFGPLHFSYESFFYGVGMGLRLNLMILCGIVFFSATKVEDFTAGLNMLGMPYSVCFALTLSFRLVPLFMESAATVLLAQRCRGLDLQSGGVLTRLRKALPVIVPVFLGAVRRAEDMAIALESKGFRSTRERTSHSRHLFRAWDIVCLLGMVAFTAAAFLVRARGYGMI